MAHSVGQAQDLKLILGEQPGADTGCAGCLRPAHAAVAYRSGLPLTIATMPNALKIAVNHTVVVRSVAAHS